MQVIYSRDLAARLNELEDRDEDDEPLDLAEHRRAEGEE